MSFQVSHRSASQEVVVEYLNVWSAFEESERAKAGYEMARRLGRYLEMLSDLEFIQ